MPQRHSGEMMESPPRVNNWDKMEVVLYSLKRKLAPQPRNSGYGILVSVDVP